MVCWELVKYVGLVLLGRRQGGWNISHYIPYACFYFGNEQNSSLSLQIMYLKLTVERTYQNIAVKNPSNKNITYNKAKNTWNKRISITFRDRQLCIEIYAFLNESIKISTWVTFCNNWKQMTLGQMITFSKTVL